MNTDSPLVTYLKGFLGKQLNVVIDRPIGSAHPEFPETVYPVNYGFVPNITSLDGEELDAYVLGVTTPLPSFRGTCIAIVVRANDEEAKLVLAPSGMTFSEKAILEQIHFQEQFFDSSLICL